MSVLDPKDFSIRPFRPRRDRALLSTGEREAFRLSYPSREIPTNMATERINSLKSVNCRAFTLLSKGKAIGYIFCALYSDFSLRACSIKSIYIEPEWRGKGCAALLLEHLERELAMIDVHTMTLDVSLSNPNAIASYEKYGFKVTRYQMEYTVGSASVNGAS